MMGQIVNLIPEEFGLSGFQPQVVFPEAIKHHVSLRRLLHLPNRLSSTSASVPLGSSVSTSKKWHGHWTARMTCVHTQEIPSFPQSKLCIVSKLHPWWFTRNSLSDLDRRNILPQPSFQWLPVFGEADRSPSWSWHWACKSQCKSTDLCLSCTPALLHYTMGFD